MLEKAIGISSEMGAEFLREIDLVNIARSNVFLALRHAGLLASKRGVGGGYTLLKPASEISVGEVLRILDGPIAPVACAVDRPTEQCTCPNPRTCPLRLLMTGLRRELTERLEKQTIEDMLKLAPASEALAFEI